MLSKKLFGGVSFPRGRFNLRKFSLTPYFSKNFRTENLLKKCIGCFTVHVIQKITKWKDGSVVIVTKGSGDPTSEVTNKPPPQKTAKPSGEIVKQNRKRKHEKREDKTLIKELKLGAEAKRNPRQESELQEFKDGKI